ncbi:MAG TPA: hypothetical protein VKX29_00405, partial [Brumimicrobium sp.]|nr:hypothetical protein [Brumimicrobium sp.]
MKNLNFQVNRLNFKIQDLIGEDIGNSDTSKLIEHIKTTDPSYQVHDPMDIDIIYESDKWAVHDAFNESLYFEFLKDKLISISFVLKNIDDEVIQLSDDIQKLYSEEMLEMKDYYTKRRDGYYQRALDSHLVVGLIEDENQKECITVISFGD